MYKKTMATLRLFDQDPYQTETEARVLESRHLGGKTGLVLDKTLFYADSGGQPSDQGTLQGQSVLEVSEAEDIILHVVHKPIEVGETVQLEIDWTIRFDHMQQHSAQHLLSQCFFMRHQAETLGFHLGRDFSTIDLNRSDFSSSEIMGLESVANAIVQENRHLRVYHITQSEADTLPIRKRPMDMPLMRIVEIQGFDWSACCGTHVKQTGELGLIKILKWERYKGGSRVFYAAGMRAFAMLQNVSAIVRETARELGVHEAALVPAIQKLVADKKQIGRDLKQAMQEMIRLEAESMLQNADNLGSIRYIQADWEQDERQIVMPLVQTLIESPQVLVLMRVRQRQQLIIGKSKTLMMDLSSLVQEVCRRFDGKGGGGAQMIQLVFSDHSQYHRAFEYVKNALSQLLVI